MAELEACPFCGWNPPADLSDVLYPNGSYRRYNERHGVYHYVSHNQSRKGDEPCWSMHCTSNMGGCGAEISADTQKAAIAAWNRRPPTIPADVGRRAMEALEGLLPQTFIPPSPRAAEIAHWQRERELGNGEAPFVLAAFAAITELKQYLPAQEQGEKERI